MALLALLDLASESGFSTDDSSLLDFEVAGFQGERAMHLNLSLTISEDSMADFIEQLCGLVCATRFPRKKRNSSVAVLIFLAHFSHTRDESEDDCSQVNPSWLRRSTRQHFSTPAHFVIS